MLMPVRKGDSQILRCSRCGYEENITDAIRKSYTSKVLIDESKHVGIALDTRERRKVREEEREAAEDYYKQLLDNLYESESESED